MTRYQCTPSKRTRRIVQTLIVAMTAALIVAITACSGEQPPPTPRPQRVDPGPMGTIEAMALQMAALQTQAAQPRATAAGDQPQPQPTEKPATAVTPTTPTPDPTATPGLTATLPPPPKHRPSDNICRRSPGIQNALINKLNMSSCQIITIEELFRLNDEFSATLKESPRQGDFAGMANVRKLRIRMDISEGEQGVIPDQFLHGLIKLETLELELRGKLTIKSHAIHNLPKIKSITIRSYGNLTIEKEFASAVPKLAELNLQLGPTSHLKEHALNNLNRITELENPLEGRSQRRTHKKHHGTDRLYAEAEGAQGRRRTSNPSQDLHEPARTRRTQRRLLKSQPDRRIILQKPETQRSQHLRTHIRAQDRIQGIGKAGVPPTPQQL